MKRNAGGGHVFIPSGLSFRQVGAFGALRGSKDGLASEERDLEGSGRGGQVGSCWPGLLFGFERSAADGLRGKVAGLAQAALWARPCQVPCPPPLTFPWGGAF